jgi:hypothetical protein
MKDILIIITFFLAMFQGWGLKTIFWHNDRSVIMPEYSEAPLPLFQDSSVKGETRYIFVGAETCAGKCHNNKENGHQFDSWKRSRHSESYESLKTRKAHFYGKKAGIHGNVWESLACLKCHVTASEADSSSIGATYKKEDGVTCESCHKGEFIPKTYLPKEEDCLKCHNGSGHKVSHFDFGNRCLKISHPRPGSGKM